MKTFLLIISGLALYVLLLLEIQSYRPDEAIVVAHGEETEQVSYGVGWTVKDHRKRSPRFSGTVTGCQSWSGITNGGAWCTRPVFAPVLPLSCGVRCCHTSQNFRSPNVYSSICRPWGRAMGEGLTGAKMVASDNSTYSWSRASNFWNGRERIGCAIRDSPVSAATKMRVRLCANKIS